ncbi:MAG: histidinol-phosphatase HisJ family protein [Ruminococcaceae bacterium]|nr:histidinol-phosphatase HisJ family protein [Oscillospiraceae bacterium]
MLTNYHTHTTFCDGKNTPEEVAESAGEKGFDALGFSGHAGSPYSSYGIKDMRGYITAVKELKEKYKGKLQIYLGVEEDMYAPVNRDDYEYLIGSAHYIFKNGVYYPLDSTNERLMKCVSECFDNDAVKLAESYYSSFCDYIFKRRPDIVGHFDLITKFDEKNGGLFSENREYLSVAKKYMEKAASSGCLFEVNTGAISRGYATTPYPREELLYVLKKCGGDVILSSDSHSRDTLDCFFDETKKLLRFAGFEYTYILYDGSFIRDSL